MFAKIFLSSGTRGAVAWLAVQLALTGARPAEAADQWHKVSTENFELFTTGGQGRGKSVVQQLEQVRSFFLQSSNSRPRTDKPVRVILFPSEKQFEPYRTRANSPAYYLAGHDSDTIVMGPVRTDLFPVTIHEYVHLLIRHTKAKYPLWLNEGTADLYSTLTPVAGKVRVGDFPMGRYHALRQGKMLSMAELTSADSKSGHYNERNRVGVFYGQSWALTHMLILSKEYGAGYRNFLKLIVTGTEAEEAFRQTYGKGFAEVERDLQSYIRQDSFYVALLDAKLEKRAAAPEVAPADEVEVELALAGLLAGLQKPAEARYREIAGRFPQRPEPHEALAYLALREDKRSEAAEHFSKAGGAGSKNARMYVDWSAVADREGGSFESVTGALRKALALEPESFEANYRLGNYLMRNNRFGEALNALRQIKRVEPDQAARLFLAKAYCFDRLKMAEDAGISAREARKYAKEPAETEAAERFLAYLERRAPALAEAGVAIALEPGAPSLRRVEPSTVEESREARIVDLHPKVAGSLKAVECMGANARIVVQTADGEMGFWIEDPGKIVLSGGAGGEVEFACGPQAGKKVVIGYAPQVDAKRGTAGLVRSIEFQ